MPLDYLTVGETGTTVPQLYSAGCWGGKSRLLPAVRLCTVAAARRAQVEVKRCRVELCPLTADSEQRIQASPGQGRSPGGSDPNAWHRAHLEVLQQLAESSLWRFPRKSFQVLQAKRRLIFPPSLPLDGPGWKRQT